jgi:hypothetical protein
MERPLLGPSERRAAVALIDPNEQTTLQAGSDTKPCRTVLAAYFRIADFVSETEGLSRAEPEVRIHPPTAASLRTFGP